MKSISFLLLITWCYRAEAFSKSGNLEPISKDEGDSTSKVTHPGTLIFQNKCIKDIGCFYTGPPFYDPIYRPESLAPTSKLKVHFLLFTPSNPDEGEEINPTVKSISESSFDPNSQLKVLIHGYRTHLKRNGDQFQIKDALLNFNKYNVIIVNWTENNQPPYPQAVANGRAVGALLANLLKVIMSTIGLKPQNIHIIGHSLGAHASGWTGERIPNLGRITGLDPAGPYFHNADKIVRLDITDAQFLDVIHTDGGLNMNDGFGLYEPIGHMDFYPNGGKSQPGCTSETNNSNGTTSKDVPDLCSHARAKSYFLESIDNFQYRFIGILCNSYEDFEKLDCLSEKTTVAEMGFHAKRVNEVPIMSKFCLRTNDEKTFCIQSTNYLTNCKN